MDWTDRFFGGHYQRLYHQQTGDEEVTERQAAFVSEVLALDAQSRVLDVCCGGGRHALALAPRVKEVVGFDRTAAFLEAAQEKARLAGVENVAWVEGDVRQLPFAAEFDAAYNYFTSWGYYDDADNRLVLERVLAALKPGGRFVLEGQNLPALVRNFRPREWSRTADGTVVLQETRFDLRTGRVHSTWTWIEDGQESAYEIKVFIPSPSELCRLFEAVGFVDVQALSAPDGGELTLDSKRLAVVGRRPE